MWLHLRLTWVIPGFFIYEKTTL